MLLDFSDVFLYPWIIVFTNLKFIAIILQMFLLPVLTLAFLFGDSKFTYVMLFDIFLQLLDALCSVLFFFCLFLFVFQFGYLSVFKLT